MGLNTPLWEHIAVRFEDGILELRFHTEDGPLVWSANAHRELTQAFAWASEQLDAKIVIISGTGDTFCSELDVTGFADLPWHDVWWEGRRMLRRLNDIEVPIVSVVNGPATVHSEIPVMADIVLASRDACFADRAHFPLRGTVPGDGVQLVWNELLGPARLKYWLLTGASISAEEGRRIGFVSELHDRDTLATRAWEVASDLARRSVPLLRYAKSAITMGTRPDFNKQLAYGLALQGSAYTSEGGMRPERLETTREAHGA